MNENMDDVTDKKITIKDAPSEYSLVQSDNATRAGWGFSVASS